MIKPWLDPRTKKKVKFCKSKSRMLELIEPDQLEPELGGTHKVYPIFDEVVMADHDIPPEREIELNRNMMTNLKVHAGYSEEIQRMVQRGDVLKWNLSVESKDLRISVELRDGEGEIVECIRKAEKVESSEGEYTVPSDAKEMSKFVIRLDNSYSWATGKKVSYSLALQSRSEGCDFGDGE